MQRQLLILMMLPLSFMVFLLERAAWSTLGYSFSPSLRMQFRFIAYLIGLGPMLLYLVSPWIPRPLSSMIGSYFNYHAMLIFYLSLISLLLFLCVRFLSLLGYLPSPMPTGLPEAVFGFTLLSVSLLIGFGIYSASYPKVFNYSVEIAKSVSDDAGFSTLSIVAISDIHWETLRNDAVVKRSVAMINELKPDVVVILGDSVTRDASLFIRDAAEILGDLEADLGVYAVLGNHDYYGSRVSEITETYRKAGISLLRDQVITLADSIVLIGRDDAGMRSGARDTASSNRASLESLLHEIDKASPIIVLDHQPRDRDIAPGLGVDLQLSGHTHAGQVWPINLITTLMYGINQGLHYVDNTAFIVTSGIGYWGPPLRLGSRAEISFIQIVFTGN